MQLLFFTGEEVRRVIVRPVRFVDGPKSKFWTLNTLSCRSLTLQVSVLQRTLALVLSSVEQHVCQRVAGLSRRSSVRASFKGAGHYVNKYGNVGELPEEWTERM